MKVASSFCIFYAVLMIRESFTLPAYAKINWFLNILGKRADGFHELCTVFQTVSLHDNLTFTPDDELLLTCDDISIPTDINNLIVRAALALQEKFSIRQGAKIHLEKRIPSPGGLGGGSADAAVALIGLSKLWNLEVSTPELCEIGAKLGSDVPFFFCGGTAGATGRGTEIFSLEDIEEEFLLIITPRIAVSTSDAFGKLNAPRLTKYSTKSIFKFCRDEAKKLASNAANSKNDFEKTIFEIYPEIRRVKEKLLESGATSALMSGSGASVFGIFEKEETRQATIKALQDEVNWRKFAVATVTRDSYREALKSALKVVSD